MLTYRHPPAPKPGQAPLVAALAPEQAPPPGTEVTRPKIPLTLTGWWVEPCWLCGTWLWQERHVNDQGQMIPPVVSARARPYVHCDTTWKSLETLFVPYGGPGA
jgi:hypothetical protein